MRNYRQFLLPVTHEDEREDTVEGGEENVRDGEVNEEIVGDAPHAACLLYTSPSPRDS